MTRDAVKLASAPRRRPRHHRDSPMVWTHSMLIIGAVVMLFPFLWQILTSFKSIDESLLTPPVFLPTRWNLDNYRKVTDALPFGAMFLNSVASVVVRTIVQVAFCSLAGYAFARLRFPFRNTLFLLLLSIMMVPRELYLLPQSEIMKSLGWLNTLPGLIAPGLFSAFGTFLMRQFFLSLPKSLEEAAALDGAGYFRTFVSVMLPLARPGMIALAIFVALFSWNEVLWPLFVNSDTDRLNLAAGLSTLVGQGLADYPMMMAGSLLAEVPMIILFLLLQRRFIEGIAFTGSK
ncbi:carbohydrate ABC transporter permease [Micromonospora coxensis]|uniref:Carbohydrate ABC transporter membrane protein 2, CUT1 family n=1 Tax=Micromonospora coxensis TaxID=356852 RepID=A0A1C5GXA1_9ACTN|nr:carbohydrate ABC transporter permease [Micromonospora coxensis]SCG37771.1 carbohydrate ABC transporter membrane protein 2, CUT1 family [Micromonospora coxensis]